MNLFGTKFYEKRVWNIREACTHPRPHLDEWAALWVAVRFGDAWFPGVADAELKFFQRSVHNDGREERKWLEDGVLFLGVRGGMFDDHPHNEWPDHCTMTLMMLYLGVDKDPALREVERHIHVADRRSGMHPFHLANLVKDAHRSLSVPDIARTVHAFLESQYVAEQGFQDAMTIVRTRGERHSVRNVCAGASLTLYVIDGEDSEDLAKAARHKDGARAALVVVRKTTGHVYIARNDQFFTSDMGPLAARLRLSEQEMTGQVMCPNLAELAVPDEHPLIPEWFHFHGQVMNGSLTAPDVPQTKVPLTRIVCEAADYLERAELTPCVGR